MIFYKHRLCLAKAGFDRKFLVLIKNACIIVIGLNLHLEIFTILCIMFLIFLLICVAIFIASFWIFMRLNFINKDINLFPLFRFEWIFTFCIVKVIYFMMILTLENNWKFKQKTRIIISTDGFNSLIKRRGGGVFLK